MVVIVIASILFMVGIGAYSGSVVHHETQAAVGRITADLALARQHAMATGSQSEVVFHENTGQYELSGLNHPDRPSDPYEIDLAATPYEATIVSVDFDGDTTIIFDAYGNPDSGGTVVISVGDRQTTLTVDADTGQVTVE